MMIRILMVIAFTTIVGCERYGASHIMACPDPMQDELYENGGCARCHYASFD